MRGRVSEEEGVQLGCRFDGPSLPPSLPLSHLLHHLGGLPTLERLEAGRPREQVLLGGGGGGVLKI